MQSLSTLLASTCVLCALAATPAVAQDRQRSHAAGRYALDVGAAKTGRVKPIDAGQKPAAPVKQRPAAKAPNQTPTLPPSAAQGQAEATSARPPRPYSKTKAPSTAQQSKKASAP